MIKGRSYLKHLRAVTEVEDAPDSISITPLCSNIDLPPGEPKRRTFVPARRFDLQEPLLAVRFKGADVVTVAVPV